jgi:Ca2+/Na+ antiporter
MTDIQSLKTAIDEIVKCRYKRMNESLEKSCAWSIFVFFMTLYYFIWKVFVSILNFSCLYVFLVTVVLILLSVLLKSLTENKKKRYIFEFKGLMWKATLYPTGNITIQEDPCCIVDKVDLSNDNFKYYCSVCGKQYDVGGIEGVIAKNKEALAFACADRDNSFKIKKRYLPV